MFLRKLSFFTITVLLLLSCKENVLLQNDEPMKQEFYGNILITSSPEGLRIFIDGKYYGVNTPNRINTILEGEHTITLKHELYPDTTYNTFIGKNDTTKLYFNCLNNPRFYGKFTLVSNPTGANVYLNGIRNSAITPCKVSNLVPGIYKIRISKFDFRDDSVEVKLIAPNNMTINRILEDTSKYVNYSGTNTRCFVDNRITDIVIDKDNILWVGTSLDGIYTYSYKKSWSRVIPPAADFQGRINRLFVDSKNRVWISIANGLFLYQNGVFTRLHDQLSLGIVNDIAEDKNGNIYLATIKGLFVYNNSSWQQYNTLNSNINNEILNCLTITNNNGIYIGSQNGLIQFKNNIWSHFPVNVLLADFRVNKAEGYTATFSEIITSIVADKNDYLFMDNFVERNSSTTKITFKYNGIRSDTLTISRYRISRLIKSQDGGFFAATGGGLLEFENGIQTKKFTVFPYPLMTNVCTSVYFDKSGNIWIGTNGGGVTKIKKGFF